MERMRGAAVFAGWTPSGVVFDCDGLLVDTEPCWTVAETQLFARPIDHTQVRIGEQILL